MTSRKTKGQLKAELIAKNFRFDLEFRTKVIPSKLKYDRRRSKKIDNYSQTKDKHE